MVVDSGKRDTSIRSVLKVRYGLRVLSVQIYNLDVIGLSLERYTNIGRLKDDFKRKGIVYDGDLTIYPTEQQYLQLKPVLVDNLRLIFSPLFGVSFLEPTIKSKAIV